MPTIRSSSVGFRGGELQSGSLSSTSYNQVLLVRGIQKVKTEEIIQDSHRKEKDMCLDWPCSYLRT